MKYVSLMVVAAGLGMAPPMAAWAYIPPSQFIVKNMATKHGGYKGIRLRTTVTAVDGEKQGTAHFKQVTVYDPRTRVLRSRAYDDAGKELYAIERVLPAPAPPTLKDEPVDPSLEPALKDRAKAGSENLPLADPLLFESDVELLSRDLQAAGVPVRTEAELLLLKDEDERRAAESLSLGRWKGTTSWIVALDGKKDAIVPQLWVEKDSFLPQRLVSKADDGAIDLRFENYRFVKEFPFPRLISVVKTAGGKETTLFREELNDILVNPTDMSELKGPLTAGYTDLGNSSDTALRDLVRGYFQYLR